MSYSERDLRQREIIPPDALSQTKATVVGVGAIGRQVAVQLAAIGVPALQLIDHDIVEPVNLAPQAYFAGDVGRSKVSVTAELCRQLHPQIRLMTDPHRFRRSMETGNTVFCCVDSIRTRRMIWEAVRNRVTFFGDARMSGEVLRVLACSDDESREHYPSTLFAGSEAYVGGCTSRATIYCANVAAGLLITQFTKHLRGMSVEPDLQLNLLAVELSIFAAD